MSLYPAEFVSFEDYIITRAFTSSFTFKLFKQPSIKMHIHLYICNETTVDSRYLDLAYLK